MTHGWLEEGARKVWRWRRNPTAHFIHVGKAAGSAVRLLLRQGSLRERLGRRYRVHLSRDHAFTLRDVPEGDVCFFFIRDPIARFVSGFNSRLRQGRPEFDYPHTPEEAETFRLFPRPNDLGEALSSPRPSLRKSAHRAFATIGHLRRDYAHYLVDPAYLDRRFDAILFIGRQETFDASWRALQGRLGVVTPGPEPPPRVHATPPGFATALSAQAVANLRQKLRPDYEIYAHLTESERWQGKFRSS